MKISEEIENIFNEDQAEREDMDFKKMEKNDVIRLKRVKEIYVEHKKGDVDLSGEDLYRLGIVFQHSPETEDYLIAAELGLRAGELGNDQGKWLSAAAEDRYLTMNDKKQKWGTQFRKDKDGNWEQFPMQSDEESGVTDIDRKERGVSKRNDQLSDFIKNQISS